MRQRPDRGLLSIMAAVACCFGGYDMQRPGMERSAVLPKGTRLFPVSEITTDNMSPYLAARAGGFGSVSALYSPGIKLEQLTGQAECFVPAWKTQCVAWRAF